jgi:CheY-like chemotaxis protein
VELNQEGDTILVVDDSLAIREIIKNLLERAGYAVATAADGQDGLNFFRQYRSRIILLLTDVSMPNMNGVDLADRVLDLEPDMPVLYMSADAWNFSRGLGCLSKPFTALELVSRVSDGLGARRKREELKSSAA